MSCERPIILRNPRGGTLQAICGTCRGCLIDDIKGWTLRLENEQKHAYNAFFVTLTYSDDYNEDILKKDHLQGYIKKLRNLSDYKRQNSINNVPPLKYFAVGEYGEQYGRPHYHLIVFNVSGRTRDKAIALIQKAWEKGYIVVDEVNRTTIQYVCKYVFKQKTHKNAKQRPFRLMSKGLGLNYVKTHTDYHLVGQIYHARDEATILALPRYYREKILDDEFKERARDEAREHGRIKHAVIESQTAEQNVKSVTEQIIARRQKYETFKQKMNKSNLN